MCTPVVGGGGIAGPVNNVATAVCGTACNGNFYFLKLVVVG